MRGWRKNAFTLVELLVVMVILGLLLALLTPALSGVFAVWQTTRCKKNLLDIYQAHGLWRADHAETLFARGLGWVVEIFPYLERADETLTCPARKAAPGDNPEDDEEPEPETTGVPISAIAFRIWSGATHLYDIPLTAPGIRKMSAQQNTGSRWIRYGIEDLSADSSSGDNWTDIIVEAEVYHNRVFKIFFSAQNTGHGYHHAFLLFGRVIFDPNKQDDSYYTPGSSESGSAGGVRFCDYGMSQGWYEVAGSRASRVEGDRFFILDYPVPLADYNGDMTDDDSEMFFIDETRIPDWEEAFSDNPYGLSWEEAQSLRHFGMTNVLFLDGHIETLPLEPQSDEDLATDKYLRPDSSLWRYGGP